MHKHKLMIASIVVLLLAFASLVLAASFTVPSSNLVVKGVINLASGREAEYGVREGVMITIEEPGKSKLGLVPIIKESLKGAKFTAFRLISDGGDEEKVVYIPGAKEVDIEGEPQIAVEQIKVGVKEIREEKFPTQPKLSGSPSELKKIYGDEKCCLTCDGTKVCASSVEMNCGRCSKY